MGVFLKIVKKNTGKLQYKETHKNIKRNAECEQEGRAKEEKSLMVKMKGNMQEGK